MGGLTKKKLRKHLYKLEKEEIILETLTLFEKFKNVREFYKAELSDDKNPLLKVYKKKISDAYQAVNPKERRTNMNVNRLITEFKKVSVLETDTIDLMLYRVECGIAAIERNGKRTSTFYNCIISTFAEAVKLMDTKIIRDENMNRLEKIIERSTPEYYRMRERLKAIIKEI